MIVNIRWYRSDISRWFRSRAFDGACEVKSTGACPCKPTKVVPADVWRWETRRNRWKPASVELKSAWGTSAWPDSVEPVCSSSENADCSCKRGEIAKFRRRNFEAIAIAVTHPASKLKLYIQDVEAALKTLHQTRWCFRSTRNSHAFGLCRLSFPATSKPMFRHVRLR